MTVMEDEKEDMTMKSSFPLFKRGGTSNYEQDVSLKKSITSISKTSSD